jgi:hypothetical protein
VRLINNDKFLKEVPLYHPDALDLYMTFIYFYHVMRVKNESGGLTAAESTLLSDMEREYPASALPVPGNFVDSLQSITATENPYSWLGNIVADVPETYEFRSPHQAYLLDQRLYLTLPSPPMLIAQLIASAARARPDANNFNNLGGLRFTSPGAANGNTNAPIALRTDSTERLWLTTPHGRFPPMLNLRVAQSFHDAVYGSANVPFVQDSILDLPNMNAITSPANLTLASYIGVIDHEGVNPRRMSYRRWPLQLANMAATISKYVSGSRYLADINTTGLGALHHISKLVDSVVIEDRDPNVVQPGHAAAITQPTYAQFHVNSVNAVLHVRDPVANDLSTQYQMITQTNLDVALAVNGDNPPVPLGPQPTVRTGPFWDYPICENGPEAAVANILLSHLPNFIRSNPRRGADE